MVRRLPFLATVLVACGLAIAGDLPPEPCVRLLREARIAQEAGRRDEAVALTRKAVDAYPKEAIPVIVLLQLNRDASAEAAAAAREQLRARLFASDAALPVSAIRYLSEDPKARPEEIGLLRESVTAALAKSPSDAKLLEAAYRLDLRLDDRVGALAIVERQIAAGSRTELLWRRLDLCTALERWDDAAAGARAILAVQPGAEMARVALIEALIRGRHLDAARSELDAHLAATTTRILPARSLLVPLAWAYWDAGRDADALAAFKRAVELDPAGEEAKVALDLLFATPEQRLAHAAKRDDRWAHETNAVALFEEGTKRLAAGDAASAYDLLARAVAADPRDDVRQYNLAMAAIKLERFAEAEAALEASIAVRPDRAQAFLQLGRVREARDACEAALEPLDRALAMRPDLNEAHFYRYKCLLKLGRAADAAKELEVYKAGKATKP